MSTTACRDIVVIGTSAGGTSALKLLLSELHEDFPATVFLTRHVSRDAPKSLDVLLSRWGPLLCSYAEHGAPLKRGHLYIAPPDQHLLLGANSMVLVRGPLENRSRPAIDPLFRSAAAQHSGRIVGVLLSGYLNDGTAGLSAIKRCGGLAVVQQPQDADCPDMPRSAIENVEVDYVLPAARIGALLNELVRQPAPKTASIPEDIRIEAGIAANEGASMANEFRLGNPSRFSCPDCGGVLWNIEDGKLVRYRCHVGHAYTETTLCSAQNQTAEYALWAALRALRERTAMLKQLARRATQAGQERSAEHFGALSAECRDEAERIEQLLSRIPDSSSVGLHGAAGATESG